MIAIRTPTGEIIVLGSSARLLAGEHAVIAEVPVGSSCDADNGCVIDREFWTLAEVADHEAAQRILAILWRRLAASDHIDMADVLREAGA